VERRDIFGEASSRESIKKQNKGGRRRTRDVQPQKTGDNTEEKGKKEPKETTRRSMSGGSGVVGGR